MTFQHAKLVLGVTLSAAAAFVWFTTAAAQADNIRCKDRLVSTGASKYDVQALCGPPDAVESRVERRSVQKRITFRCADGSGWCSGMIADEVVIPVDEWTYDFGSQRFVRYLTFEDGKLLRVRSGGYGHKRP